MSGMEPGGADADVLIGGDGDTIFRSEASERVEFDAASGREPDIWDDILWDIVKSTATASMDAAILIFNENGPTMADEDTFIFDFDSENNWEQNDPVDEGMLLIEIQANSDQLSGGELDLPTDSASDGGGGTDVPDCIIWNIDGADVNVLGF